MSNRESKKKAKEITDAISKILFNDWDPLEVNDIAPDDEYDSYVGGLYGLLTSDASRERIAEHLFGLERDAMESPSSPDHRNSVADKLLRIGMSN